MRAVARACREVFVAPGNAGTALEPKLRNVAIAADDIAALRRVRAARGDRPRRSSAPRRRWSPASSTRSRAAGLRLLRPERAPRRASRAPRPSPRISCAATASRPPPTRTLRRAPNFDPAWVRAQRAAARRQGRRARRRQGRRDLRHARGGDRRRAGDVRRDAFGAAGDDDRRRGIPRRARRRASSSMADGQHVLPLATSQDHKRLRRRRPRARTPAAWAPIRRRRWSRRRVHERVMREVIAADRARRCAADGSPTRGFLYAGLMIAPDGTPNVLEFNCRFGDPGDAADHDAPAARTCPRCARRRSTDGSTGSSVDWDPRAALGVVLAAGGYPESYAQGRCRSSGLDARRAPARQGVPCRHRSSRRGVVTNGGRVLCAVGLGDTVARRSRRPMRSSTPSASRACSTAATSATAPSRARSRRFAPEAGHACLAATSVTSGRLRAGWSRRGIRHGPRRPVR